MIISRDVWNVSTGVEFVRNGNQVTLILAGSANGYYDPDLGYWEWFGYMEANLGAEFGYIDQYFGKYILDNGSRLRHFAFTGDCYGF